MNNYRIETLTTTKQLLEKEDEWLAFEDEINDISITYSYHYLQLFWLSFKDATDIKELGISRQLLILFLYKNSHLIAIFPFCRITRKRKKIFIVHSIEFIGQQVFSNYSDIISKGITEDEFSVVQKWLYKNVKFDMIFLSHISSSSKNIESVYKNKLYPFNQCAEVNLDKNQTYDDYKSNNMSANYRHIINNAYNRIKKANIKINIVFKNFEADDIVEIKRISEYKIEKGKYNVYNDDYKNNFLIHIYNKFQAKVLFIQFDNKNVSFLVFINYQNQTVWFDMSYDRAYQKFRPGILLYDNCLKESIVNSNYHNIVGWGTDSHKLGFCNDFIVLNQYLQQGNTLISKIWFTLKKKNSVNKGRNLMQNSLKIKNH